MAYRKLFTILLSLLFLITISAEAQNLTHPMGLFKVMPDTVKMRFIVISGKDSSSVIVVYGYVVKTGNGITYLDKNWVSIKKPVLYKDEYEWF